MNNQLKLSESGQKRRQEMLQDLQHHLGTQVSKRAVRRRIQKTAALSVLVALMGIGTWITLTQLNSENHLKTAEEKTVNETGTQFTYVSIESNREEVIDRYVVSKHPTQLALETIDDDELLELLNLTGNPSALGTIDGKLTLISTKLERN